MTEDQAQTAVAGSALIVGGIYAYRKLVEPAITPTTKQKGGRVAQELGYGPPPPVGRFITAWGFVYLVLSLVSQASPNLGGSFAILVAIGDVLGNGSALADDIRTGLSGTAGLPPIPHTAGGIPVYDPSKETGEQYDQRMYDYLRTHPPQPAQPASPNPLIPGNSLGGSPFPSRP